MANDINRVLLIGRLVKAPEMRYTPSGKQVANFTIANNRSYTVSGQSERKDYVSFFNCVAWGNLGEAIAKYCQKGNRIALEGRLQQRTWEKDGEKRSSVDVVVDTFQFLEYKKKDSANGTSEEAPPLLDEGVTGTVPGFDDAIPAEW